MGPKITAFCPTLNRPDLLPRAIACFENQTYENRELVILDDGGQYLPYQKGDRWEIISVSRRFRSLGEKNNAAIAMASFDTMFYAKMDDDDCYASWWLESIVEALGRAPVCQPRQAIDFVNGAWTKIYTYNDRDRTRFAYHGCWGYRRSFIEKTGGYRPEYAGDDQELDRRRIAAGIASVGIDRKFQPFYWYNRPLPGRLSERGGSQQAYVDTGKDVPYVGKVPEWTGEKVWERKIPTGLIPRGW